ncbi:MAG: mechanosensitive ion channel family protein [Actinomycetota bacterium]
MPILADHAPITSREWLLSHGIAIAVILAGAFVLLALSGLAVGRMQRRLEGAESETQELNLQRAATLAQAVSYVVKIAVWTVTLLLLLGEFGLDVGPLIAGAGIAGVALGFGAQSVVKDFLSGFFFLLEDQFSVGNLVTLNAGGKEGLEGRVEAMSLRTTELRDDAGTLHIIPNGNITVVGNRSRTKSRRPPPRV